MTLADVNILVGAFRTDHPSFSVANRWLQTTVLADHAFAISPLILSAVIRVTTQRRFMSDNPSTLEDAFGFCSDLLAQPHCCIIEPGTRHWSIFERLCRTTDTRGPRVTDAWFAALAIEHGCTWISFDRDFARFPGLKWDALG